MRSRDLNRTCRKALLGVLGGATLGLSSTSALAQTDQEIADAFSVSQFTLQEVVVKQKAPQHAFVEVSLDGEPVQLSVFRSSVRAPDFRVLLKGENGVEEFTPAPSRVYKGNVVGDGESRVSGTIIDGAFSGSIIVGDEYWGVQPLTEAFPDADPDTYVVYESDETYQGLWHCGVDDNVIAHPRDVEAPAGPIGGGLKVAELAFDADFELFSQDFGSNEQAVIDFIETRTAGVNAIYEAEVGITHVITEIIVRTNVNDPYTTSNPSSLLGQFQNHWNSQQQGVQRDVAHLWTGKNLQGGVIGIAFLNGVCSTFQGYGLSERFTSNSLLLNCLMAHELGHNWSANHCDGTQGCAIMCSGINGCGNGCTTFGTFATNSITNFASFANCLDDGVPPGGGESDWTIDVDNNDGDNVIEPGESATVKLTLNFEPDNPDNDFQGLAATVFNVLNAQNAETGSITTWDVLNNLDALTGDLTETDGVQLFNVNAGQLTQFGDFVPGSPLDILEFEWVPDSFDGQVVIYTTDTEVVQVWETVPGEGDVAFDYGIGEESAVLVVATADECLADCNGDGSLNILDFTCFQDLFASGDPDADCNNDGSLDVLDFICFQGAFSAGCP